MTKNEDGHHVLETITVNKKELKGIIDYVTSKHVIFYDFTNNNDPDVSMICIVWKTYFSQIRFSVFKSIHFPKHDIGQPYLLRKKDIADDFKIPKAARSKRSITRITRESHD